MVALATRLTALVVVAAFLAVPLPAAAAKGGSEPLLLTLKDGVDLPAFLAAHPRSTMTVLADGVVLAEGTDAANAAGDPRVAAAEPEGVVRAATASWDRASWDTASWDRAGWDTASWDRASWDRASWDGGAGGSDAFATWGQRAVGARPLEAAEGALVCLIDSGIDSAHPQLHGRVTAGVDLVRGDAFPEDEAGHGTHLAGIVAASAEGPMFGVSGARLAVAKIFDAQGEGRTSDLVRALDWCARQGSDVVLMALSEDSPTKALERALRDARRSGALLVASAGNGGDCARCVSSPASDAHVLAVAALAPDLSRAAFSSRGPELDIAAPGAGILSTYPGGGWRVGSGTSQAAAFAAGLLAALVGDAHPPDQAQRLLVQGALDLDRPGRDPATGHGLGRLGEGRA